MLRSPWTLVVFLFLAGVPACSGLVKGAYVGPPDNAVAMEDAAPDLDAADEDASATGDVCVDCGDLAADGVASDVDAGQDGQTGDGAIGKDDGTGPEDPGTQDDPGEDATAPILCGETSDCTGKLYALGEGSCNKAICAGGTCLVMPVEIGTACDDGNRCRKKDTCQPGDGTLFVCTPGPEVVVCDDGDPCTDDVCVPTTGGCMTKANQAACDDGNPCTKQDACASGMCVGTQNECPCGQDSDCDAHDDGNPCNGDLVCQGTVCEIKSGSTVVCPLPAGAPCRVSACDPASGECVEQDALEGTVCDDGFDCSQGDRCVAGKCTALTGQSCDDENPCTNDWCDAQLQCQHAFNDSECEPGRCVDGSHISASVCTAGACSAPFETKCEDDNVCTVDSCTPEGGCKHAKFTGACHPSKCENFHFYPAVYCDDDNQCAPQIPVDCRDSSPCTEDICDSVKGCEIGEIVGWCPSDIPGCIGSCANNVCTFPAETLDGTDEDCDGFVDEEFDVDHDGVCLAETCAVHQPDLCPTVWSPDNEPSWCYPVTTAWTRMREVVLREPGFADRVSPDRRTAEVVEIPLRNGYLDDSVIGWWPIDGGTAVEGSGNGVDGKVSGCTSGAGAFGGAEGALKLAGATSSILFTGADLGCRARTLMAWVRLDATTGIAGRILANGAASIGVSSGKESVDCTFGSGTPVESTVGLLDGTWHHVACVLENGRVHLFVDGVLDAAGSGGPGTCASPDAGVNRSGTLKGAVDDLVLLDRPASPFEVLAVARSAKPYGTSLVPGARADLDDVRITAGVDADSPQVPVELVGVRPRSPSDFEDIVAFWKLDGNGLDVLGLHDGTGTASASRGRFGDPFGAVTPGAGGGILVPYASTLDVQHLTLEAWVRPDDADLGSGQHAIIGRANDTCCWDLGISDGALRMRVKVGPSWATVSAPLDPGTAGRWTHVAGTFDGSTVRLFVDGTQEASVVAVGAIAYSGATRIVIGDNPGPDGLAGEPFLGTIDEAVFHEVAKAPAYLLTRTRPSIPAARFLARTGVIPTSGADYEYERYALRWANPDAASDPASTLSPDAETRCDGLLTDCFGYGGLWRFDGYGTSVPDLADSANAGTLGGGPLLVPGANGPGLVLDGVDDRMTAGPTGLPTASGAVSVEAVWTREGACAGTARIAGRQDATGGFGIDFACASGKVSAFAGPSGSPVKAESSTALVAGREYAVAAVLKAGRLSIFVDGQEAGYATATAPSLAVGSAFLVGSSGSAAYLPGFVRMVRYMLRGLATDELLRAGARSWKLGAVTDASGKPVQ